MHASMLYEPRPAVAEAGAMPCGIADGEGTDLLCQIRRTHLLQVFAVLLQSTELVRTLSGKGPFTVFAPCNAAFGALPADFLHDLMRDMRLASTLLTHHVTPSSVADVDLREGSVLALRGERICTGIDARGSWYGGSRLMGAAIPASNGVLRIVNKVLLPSTLSVRRFTAASAAAARQSNGWAATHHCGV